MVSGRIRLLAPLFAGAAVLACSMAQPTPTAILTAPATTAPTASRTSSPTATATATASSASSPTIAPDRLGLEPFASGLEPLVFLANAGDGSGRLFAVEQHGVI